MLLRRQKKPIAAKEAVRQAAREKRKGNKVKLSYRKSQ
jgi:hypothetical protein